MKEVLWLDCCKKRVTGSETQVLYRQKKKKEKEPADQVITIEDSYNFSMVDTQAESQSMECESKL